MLTIKTRVYLLLFSVVVLGFVLRFYNLGSIPTSLDWDEASLGWNAVSILKTGTDEFGKRFPASIRSFNDYKPPGYVYMTIPSVAIFGLSEFSIRFPSMVVGVLSLILSFQLVLEISKHHLQKANYKFALLTSFLLAVSPWHIQFSRVAFESNLALFFFIAGVTCIYLFFNSKRLRDLILCTFSFSMAIYSYHSARLVIPAFVLGLGLKNFRFFLGQKKMLAICALLFGVLMLPLVRDTLRSSSVQARFDSVGIIEKGKPLFEYPPLIATNFLKHFTFDFLFLDADGNERHHAPGSGLMYLIEAPFLLGGLYFLFKNKSKLRFIILLWLLCAPIASSLTKDTPHAVRSLIFLPAFQILVAYGIINMVKSSRVKLFSGLIALLYFVNIFFYLDSYFLQMPKEYEKSWQFGYRQMVREVLAIENGYRQIYITPVYDQPYIYFLLYGRIDPIIKNNGYFSTGFDKYVFTDYSQMSDSQLKKISKKDLFVLSPKENLSGFEIIKQINFSDGTLAFTIAKKI